MRVFCLLVGVLFWGLLVRPAEAGSRPNVLFVAIDDLNDFVGAFRGHAQARTPHLDRFAREGAVVFQSAHCPGPVCGPSRSALLSGFMPHTTGVYGNSQNMLDAPLLRGHATLPEYFSKHGYVSKSMGKIFHRHATSNGADPGHWAFDQYEPTRGGSPVDQSRVTSRNRNLINGKPGPESAHTGRSGSEFAWGPTRGPKEETKDYQTARWAAEQLGKDHDKPFFLAVGLSRPHLPFYVPQEFFDLYDSEETRANRIREDDLDDILTPSGKKKHRPSDDYLWLKQNGLIDECARAYLAACSYADACLGVIFEAFRDSPHRDNTIVVVWGDHGWHLGEKLRYRKGSGWIESTRVPLMIRLPGMTGRLDCARAVNLIDLYPTLVELCDLPGKKLDGRSIAPLLEDPRGDWPHPTLTVFGEGNASVTDGRWHYLRYREGTEELYDLRADPMEWENLMAGPLTDTAVAARVRLGLAVPASYAAGIDPQDPGEKERMKKVKGLDRSIKPRRRLEKLR
jgi:arylsulfatase A-like enzyme